MIVERLVWHVEPENREQFVELLSSYMHDPGNPITRIYVPKIGALGTVVAELEYESLAQWEGAWEEWQSPAKATEVAREGELATMGETTIWDLVN